MDTAESAPGLSRWSLIVGDALALAVVVAIGFATHREAEAVLSTRYLATYLPFLAAWLAAAAAFGALRPERAAEPRHLWRPAAAALVAAPVGAWLRGLLLGSPVLPIFVAVMAAMMLLALGLWRTALLVALRSRSR
jgi:hypothetical protein